jgi:hypothetical protein
MKKKERARSKREGTTRNRKPAAAAHPSPHGKTVMEPKRRIPIVRSVDVAVVGGGPAGLAAAIASARMGAKTLLIEQFGYLGGTATASLMACINGFRNQVEPDTTQVVRGIAEEIVLKLKAMKGLGKSCYPQKSYPTEPGRMEYSYAIDLEKFKYLSLKLCIDAGVDILFHTYFCDCITEDRTIRNLLVENKSGRSAVEAVIVVDASGDADVAARAGVPYWQTTRDEAKRLNDGIMYRIGFGASRPPSPFSSDFGSSAVVWGPGVGPIDATSADQLSKAEIEARLKIFEDFAEKQRTYPDLKDAGVLETPPLLGIRQTRFIIGRYTITADDALTGRRFPDVVAISPCPIIGYYGYRRFLTHEGYDIPYRCLLPKKIDNLIVAGRCISSEQQPYESHRAMVPMMAVGQAAGVAAAIAAKRRKPPARIDVTELQDSLMKQGSELRKGLQTSR